MVTKADFLNKYCRICGSHDSVCLKLTENLNKKYLGKVHKLLPLKIRIDDPLPKNVCHICFAILNQFDLLRENCIKAQKTLTNIASSFHEDKEITIDDSSNDSDVIEVPIVKNEEDLSASPLSEIGTLNESEISAENSDCSNCSSEGIELVIPTEEKKPIEPELNVAHSRPELEGWTVQHIPGKNTTLFICGKCSEILLCEKARESHQCKSSKLPTMITHILPTDNLKHEEKKKKRKRIYFAEDD